MRADDVRDFFESVDAEPSPQFSDDLLARLEAEYPHASFDTSRDTDAETLEVDVPVIDLVDEQPRARHGRRGPEQPSRNSSRRRLALAVAAATALIVGAAVVVRTVSDDRVKVTPPAGLNPTTTTTRPTSLPPLPDGLSGLPPEGATPSTPATGQLLALLPIPIWVYEDGRVISARWTSGDHWTGFLEQRLTPEGVALVRAEIQALEPLEECRAGGGNYGYFDGGRIIGERPRSPQATPSDRPDMCGLPQYQRLSELQYGARSWLPASAWADVEPKPYVPSTYEFEIGPASDVPAMLAALPSGAAELLTRSTECGVPNGFSTGVTAVCFEVSTEEARQVLATLGIAPLENSQIGQFGIYRVGLVPYLPHGGAVWCCGG